MPFFDIVKPAQVVHNITGAVPPKVADQIERARLHAQYAAQPHTFVQKGAQGTNVMRSTKPLPTNLKSSNAMYLRDTTPL